MLPCPAVQRHGRDRKCDQRKVVRFLNLTGQLQTASIHSHKSAAHKRHGDRLAAAWKIKTTELKAGYCNGLNPFHAIQRNINLLPIQRH